MSGILGSVGKSGRNIRSDVVLVQELLNLNLKYLKNAKKITVHGRADKDTIALIMKYQKEAMLRDKPNGLVNPKGITLDSLHVVIDTRLPRNVLDDWTGNASRWSQEKKLRSINPPFRDTVKAVIKTLEADGHQPIIIFAWRSIAEQLKLYNKGVTRVKFSFHNITRKDGWPDAHGVDIVDSRYLWSESKTKKAKTHAFFKALGKAAEKHAAYWGGDWTRPDWAHIQRYPNSHLRGFRLANKKK